MIEIHIALFVLFCVIDIVMIYTIYNLYTKTDSLEQWVDATYLQIQDVLQDMKNLDTIGAFESDDEVGSIFKALHETLNKLDTIAEE
jgi:ABC-type transport system involved in cytochrome bd biosynthesis fused ATPase/permease subunit